MSLKSKLLLALATLLLVAGGIMFVLALMLNGWKFVEKETNEYEISEEFHSISIDIDTTDIKILPASDGVCRAVVTDDEKVSHSFTVEGGVLKITTSYDMKWYQQILPKASSFVTLYLPLAEYGKLSADMSTGDVEICSGLKFGEIDISVSTGDVKCSSDAYIIKIHGSTSNVTLENASTASVDISVTTGDIEATDLSVSGTAKLGVSTGKIRLTRVSCLSLESTGSTGDVILTDVIASAKFVIKRSTGVVEFNSSDAAEIEVETDTGDVKGTLRSEKVFIVRTDTGKINVPDSVSGGKCKITTDTGDVEISIK